jgi:hypothetical protein
LDQKKVAQLPPFSTTLVVPDPGDAASTTLELDELWAVYSAVIPDEQHTALGKETGETAHVERWNNTLRQRLSRFVRMTLSFSKSAIMHEACLLLFLHRYNSVIRQNICPVRTLIG